MQGPSQEKRCRLVPSDQPGHSEENEGREWWRFVGKRF